MTESQLYKRMCDMLGHRWFSRRVEDEFLPDTPDLWYVCSGCAGWIELKASGHSGTSGRKIRIPKLRPGQLNWLKTARYHRAVTWIGWAVGDTLLLIDPLKVAEHDISMTLEEWKHAAEEVIGLANTDNNRLLLLNTLGRDHLSVHTGHPQHP